MQSSYDESLKHVLAYEGGYTNDPRDPGGPTNWGITIWDARLYWKKGATASDVRAMPLEVAKQIYKEKYWDAQNCDQLPAGVDASIFDYGVNSGIGRSAKVLQRLVSVPADGKIGAATLAAVAKADPIKLIAGINDERLRFLQSLGTWSHFGVGWGRRVLSVRQFSLQLARHAGSAPTAVASVVPAPGKGQPPLEHTPPDIEPVAPVKSPPAAPAWIKFLFDTVFKFIRPWT